MNNALSNQIPAEDTDRLISAHDGDVALLYLYLCCRSYDADAAARALCRTEREISSAAEKLKRMGLFHQTATVSPSPAEKKLPPAEELPEYTADDISRRSGEDGQFKDVVAETQKIMGRSLSTADVKILFGIYDYLSLPPEVILELLNFCVDSSREKYGSGRMPSMRFVEKEAYVWANREILTFEQAEEYIKGFRARQESVNRTAAVMGIRGRELTPTERKYISAWLELGFSAETLEIAYDRTVTNTGALKWQYMDKIVRSWHEKGLHTPEAVNEKDGHRQTVAAAPAKISRDGLAALKNKIKSSDGK